MNISELKADKVFDNVRGEVTELGDVRLFNKFGKEGRVRNGFMKDDSGKVKITLWNDQIDEVAVGDMLSVTEGYTSEWQGQLQVSTGKNGSISVDPATPQIEEEDLEDLEEI